MSVIVNELLVDFNFRMKIKDGSEGDKFLVVPFFHRFESDSCLSIHTFVGFFILAISIIGNIDLIG